MKENDAMTMKKNDESEQARCPDPEEGYRLMRAFLSIKQTALRQAVVKMVTELSIPDDERRNFSGGPGPGVSQGVPVTVASISIVLHGASDLRVCSGGFR